ncbi:MAG: efflux RND transporter permease subunit, partial [Pseudomonadota bacterium]
MDLTRFSLRNPAALAVLLALLALFGVLAIAGRPIQLLPTLEQPQISVNTGWREAAPAEVESQIIEPQESVLRRTPGVLEMQSTISRGFGSITLTFAVDADMNEALINVINNLNQTPPLPADANEPFVGMGGQGGGNYAASIQIYPRRENANTNMDSPEYQRVLENVVEPALARIDGVARVDMNGQRPQEIRITFDPYRAAALGIDVAAMQGALTGASDASGGFADIGRRQYTVRYIGQHDVDTLGDLIVGWVEQRPIHLREVAIVEKRMIDPFGVNIRSGYPASYVGVAGTNDANTVAVLDDVNAVLD